MKTTKNEDNQKIQMDEGGWVPQIWPFGGRNFCTVTGVTLKLNSLQTWFIFKKDIFDIFYQVTHLSKRYN